jgi:hypothetical protein
MALGRRLPIEVMPSFCTTCGVTLIARSLRYMAGPAKSLVFTHGEAVAALNISEARRSPAFGERHHAG